MTTAARLQLTLDTKNAIKVALQNKGASPTDVFSTYPAVIDSLTGEGIITPAIIVPADGTTGIMPNEVTLEATHFASVPAAAYTQLWAQWQVATDSAFSNVIWDSGQDSVNLRTIDVPGNIFDPGSTYYARVRYEGELA